MELHNLMEDKVIELTHDIMNKNNGFCHCEQCRMDVVALTLNRVEPKYVVSNTGKLYGKANLLTRQSDADIVKEITKSMVIVGEKPRHLKDKSI
ncbi:MAG: late competence development ComFB family protein [Atopostipes suicloacalis]|nr:late competence development ComFB family protein [Atopostipes suicloacalis]MDN6731327.1 late competence development ComFB family protein [Atopostipes suicloacalis]